MELEVGEYVRSKQGYIAKVTSTSEEIICFDSAIQFYYEEDWTLLGSELDKVKAHSFNIIDLIEVGDYVNEYKVQDIVKTDNKHILYCEGEYVGGGIQKNQIETIVTKEQFKGMEYRINE